MVISPEHLCPILSIICLPFQTPSLAHHIHYSSLFILETKGVWKGSGRLHLLQLHALLICLVSGQTTWQYYSVRIHFNFWNSHHLFHVWFSPMACPSTLVPSWLSRLCVPFQRPKPSALIPLSLQPFDFGLLFFLHQPFLQFPPISLELTILLTSPNSLHVSLIPLPPKSWLPSPHHCSILFHLAIKSSICPPLLFHFLHYCIQSCHCLYHSEEPSPSPVNVWSLSYPLPTNSMITQDSLAVWFLSFSPVLDVLWSGFCPLHSTETTLTIVFLLLTVFILLDLFAAFDTIDPGFFPCLFMPLGTFKSTYMIILSRFPLYQALLLLSLSLSLCQDPSEICSWLSVILCLHAIPLWPHQTITWFLDHPYVDDIQLCCCTL